MRFAIPYGRPAMAQNIVIYQDEGVGPFGLSCLREFFKEDAVRLVDANSVIEGKVLENTNIFVMPGGPDKPYCRKLNGKGNANIRSFVENGGMYIGVCGGAYFASSAIEFHKGREDEICEPRELAFIDGTAIGSIPALAAPYNDRLQSASITTVNGTPVLYYGGPYFNGNAEILGVYDTVKLPAIVRQKVGKGAAILSGVHFEVTAKNLENYPGNDDSEKQIALELAEKLRYASFNWKNFLLGEKK